jgi:hypothetical protein
MCADKIRVGLIGAGANTRLRHIPGLKAQEDVEIVGVANRTAASGERIAAEYDIPNVYDNWLDIIDDDDIDAVCIGTWPYMHAPVTLAALSADKHVLVEARMAMNSHEARLMLDASRDNPHLVTQIVPAPHTILRGVRKLPPATTAFGALLNHITGGHLSSEEEPGKRSFQPMNVNFGLFPPLEPGTELRPDDWQGRFRGKDKALAKKRAITSRALADCRRWLEETRPAEAAE